MSSYLFGHHRQTATSIQNDRECFVLELSHRDTHSIIITASQSAKLVSFSVHDSKQNFDEANRSQTPLFIGSDGQNMRSVFEAEEEDDELVWKDQISKLLSAMKKMVKLLATKPSSPTSSATKSSDASITVMPNFSRPILPTLPRNIHKRHDSNAVGNTQPSEENV